MTGLTMTTSDARVMLWHMALYGLGAILEEVGVPSLRISWTAGMAPKGRVETDDVDEPTIADLVRSHAARHAANSWVQTDVTLGGKPRGLMSPRLAVFVDDPVLRHQVFSERQNVLDDLTRAQAILDMRLLAALGEPSYWSRSRQDQPLQDDGASRLEMQPRNHGSEFVGSRLRKLATTVARRDPDAVLSGLTGQSLHDEAGGDKLDSRTGTGFTTPGPVDNAVAWCALWGISQLPTVPRTSGSAVTTGHFGSRRTGEHFYLPYWTARWRPAWLRSLTSSVALRTVAEHDLPSSRVAEVDALAARAWLMARGVEGLFRFRIDRFGSDSAPERRAMLGAPISLSRP